MYLNLLVAQTVNETMLIIYIGKHILYDQLHNRFTYLIVFNLPNVYLKI